MYSHRTSITAGCGLLRLFPIAHANGAGEAQYSYVYRAVRDRLAEGNTGVVMPHRGAYFLANDGISDLTVAFLNSFRRYNPAMSLCFIPYNDQCRYIQSLASGYNFTMFSDPERLGRCDDISLRFHNEVSGQYRKLLCWEGPFEEFVYIDVDTVVLRNIDFAFEFAKDYGFLASCSDLPQCRKYVWRDSVDACAALTDRQKNFAANTGFFVSRKGCLSLRGAEAQLSLALDMKEHMELICIEQSLLNYLIVSSGKPYTSLRTLARDRRDWSIPQERWATFNEPRNENGEFILPVVPPLFLIHWAGVWRNGSHLESKLWRFYRGYSFELTTSM